ncbi:uncharacterized protein [Gossypium hirsutum]|uniref:Uncharacterized protein isoform X2 n=1 Tax=Gossypium hirsutum TaxID=3635 RepID=A0ABM3C3E8_GOSHI|nr:uncharacterized protein LOC107937028 isoform X2 [Gossypium hirsutum]
MACPSGFALAKVEFGFGSGGKSKWSISRLVPVIVVRGLYFSSSWKSRRYHHTIESLWTTSCCPDLGATHYVYREDTVLHGFMPYSVICLSSTLAFSPSVMVMICLLYGIADLVIRLLQLLKVFLINIKLFLINCALIIYVLHVKSGNPINCLFPVILLNIKIFLTWLSPTYGARHQFHVAIICIIFHSSTCIVDLLAFISFNISLK